MSRESPILVVALARPELLSRRPGWGNGLRNVVRLHLERLADHRVVELVTGYVEGLPAAGLAQLVARAEGVPLYAVETVRMLADRGVLEQLDDAYRVVPGVAIGDELDIPETLQALVAARLDGLPDAVVIVVAVSLAYLGSSGVRFLVACYKEEHREMCRRLLAERAPELEISLYVGKTSEIIELGEVCLMVSGSVSLEVLARTTPTVAVQVEASIPKPGIASMTRAGTSMARRTCRRRSATGFSMRTPAAYTGG
jgi:hypothetical protein